jgi:DNA repair exonuclease SbcCD ATPase subunit
LDIRPGLTALIGPNGSGKSTVVDALFFVLTGETIDGRNVADRINWGSLEKRATVNLTSCDFSITRTIKPTGVSHLLEAVNGTVLTKKGDINAWLFSEFAVDNSGVLKDVFFAAQLKATDLFDATESQRLALLSKVFGFDKLESCRSAIYKVLADTPVPVVNEETIAVLVDRVKVNTEKYDTLIQQERSTALEISKLEFDANKYLEVVSMPTSAEHDVHQQALTDAQNELRHLDSEYASLKTTAEFAEKADAAIKVMKSYEKELEEREKLKKEIADLDTGPSLEGLNRALADLLKQKVDVQNEIKELESRRDVDRGVCPLTGGTPCIELLRKFDPELVEQQLQTKREALAVLTADESQLNAFIQQTGESMRKLSEAQASLAQHEKLIQLCETSMAEAKMDPDKDLSEYVALREELDFTEKDAQHFQELTTERSRLQGLIESHQKWLETHPSTGTVSKEELARWQELKQQFDALNSEFGRLQLETSQLHSTLESDKGLLAKMRDDQQRAQNFQHRADLLREVRELLSRGQLQRLLLQNTIRSVNKEIEACSKIFNFPYRLFIQESGSISFDSDDMTGADVKLLSGGQKYVAAIITRLAFGRVLRTEFPFVVLDEPSTCLDDHSRELLACLLKALGDRAKQEGTYLLVPTHDELLVGAADKVIHTN